MSNLLWHPSDVLDITLAYFFHQRSQSVDNDMHKIDTPSSRRTPVFGSIERGLDKVKTIFTPRKRLISIDTPRKAKVIFKILNFIFGSCFL
jgi:hypothetical protein